MPIYRRYIKVLAEAKKVDLRTVIAYTPTVRYLERIADHASYIAEPLTYAATVKRITLR